MDELTVFNKLVDIEKDMDYLKTKFMANFADRLSALESTIQSLDDRTTLFVPDKNGLSGLSGCISKVNYSLKKHNREINVLKAQVAKVVKA